MGIGRHLKEIVPLAIYLGGFISMLRAMSGKTDWAIYLIVFLLPLRNFVERIQEFPAGTQFIDLMVFSLIIGWLVQTGNRRQSLFGRSALNGIAIVMPIYLFISLMIGSYYLKGWFAFDRNDWRVQDWKNLCLLPLLFFTVFNTVHTKKEIWKIVMIMAGVMFIVDYYTANQIRWYSSLVSRDKITGTFQFLGPNEVAAFLNEYSIILMSLFFTLKNKRLKMALFAILLGNVYCVLFTYSRAAITGLALGMMILFLFKNRKFVFPLLLAGLLWQVVLPEKAVERIKATKNARTGQLDESSQRRLNIWEVAMQMYSRNPVAGIGYGVFRDLGLDLGDTHNIYVKILVEQGTIGLIIFLLAVFGFMREGFLLYQKGQEDLDKALGLGLFICMFVLMFNNFFGDRWSYLEPNAYLWIFGALVSRLNNIARAPPAQPAAAAVEKPPEPGIAPQPGYSPAQMPPPPKVKKKIRYYDL